MGVQRMKNRTLPFWIALVTFLLWRAPTLSAESYRWVDSSGIVHFSDIRSLIVTSASRLRVDPALVEAIVAVESNFDPWAVSRRGAIGLMQLMPQTASHYGVSDPFDPQENLTGGIRHLRELLRRFSGDLLRVLAAYNAGETAVLKYRGLPPYRETKEYVQKVLARYRPGKMPPSLATIGQQGREGALARKGAQENHLNPDSSRRGESPAAGGINSVKGTRTKGERSYRPLTELSLPSLVRMRGSRTVSIKLPVHRYRRSRPFSPNY